MNKIEVGQIHNQENVLDIQNIPTVLRDRRGTRIIWSLPENTAEQNEELGIRNIQGLFLERFPEFNELFPRGEDGKIAEDKREDAKDYILSRIQIEDRKNFYRVFGTSMLQKRTAPYFNGSRFFTIEKSFAPWGITFKFSRIRGYWMNTEVIEDEARNFLQQGNSLRQESLRMNGKSSLIRAITKYYPGGMNALKKKLKLQVLRKPNDYWTPENIEKEALEFYQKEEILTQDVLRLRDRYDLLGAIAEHYPGKLTALKRKLGISNSSIDEVKLDSKRGVFIDADGERWVSVNVLVTDLRLSPKVISKYMVGISFIKVSTKNDQEVVLYNEEEFRAKIVDFLSLPRVDPQTGRFQDKEEQIWVVMNVFEQEIGIDSKTLFTDIEGIGIKKGRSKTGREVTLYNESELRARFASFASLPRVDRETRRYVDKEGSSWTTITILKQDFHIDPKRLRFLLQRVKKINGRDTVGKRVVLFNEKEAAEAVKLERRATESISSDQANEVLMKFLEVKDE